MNQKESIKELMQIPSVGISIANDLYGIGIKRIKDLENKNPRRLYEKLNKTTGATHDVCVLYTFRCAVYFASTKKQDKEKLKWWNWKNRTINEI